MSLPAAITNQPYPFSLSHRSTRRNHLPTHSRTKPFMGSLAPFR
jgi:hypothetical protein